MYTKNMKDISGQRHGHLVAIRSIRKDPKRNIIWECQCDCGRTIEMPCSRFSRNTSCGCSDSRKLLKYEASINSLINAYKKGAAKRGLEFSLTREQFIELTQGKCYLCGNPPSSVQGKGTKYNGNFIYNGIDRVNNQIGYVYDNCRSCCFTCNHMKGTMDLKDFLDQIGKINDQVHTK